MTPRELFREFIVASKKQKDRHIERTVLAWETGLFTGLASVGKLPKLAQVLRSSEKQTPEEQRSVIEQLAARLGKPLQRVRLIKRETPKQESA